MGKFVETQQFKFKVNGFVLEIDLSILSSVFMFIIILLIFASMTRSPQPSNVPPSSDYAEIRAEQNYITSELSRIVDMLENTNSSNPTQDSINYIATVDSDIKNLSGLTLSQVNTVLSGTGLEDFGQYFLEGESENNVNAWALMGIASYMSEQGTNNLAKWNNYLGWDSRNSRTFDSARQGIVEVAGFINYLYLKSDGAFYNGATLSGMNVMYVEDDEWAVKVLNHIQMMERKLK